MLLKAAKFVVIQLIFNILFGFYPLIHAQDQLSTGTTELAGKMLNVDKLQCKLVPVVTIPQDQPDNLKLSFKMTWFDKDNRMVPASDKYSLFIKYKDNIEKYCETNDKKLSTKPGLFGKSIDLNNSIEILPAGVLELMPYRGVTVSPGSPPFNIKILKQTDEPVNFNLTLYLGKEKNNSIDIDDKLDKLNWIFKLPQKSAPPEKQSCQQVADKYTQSFNENKPEVLISHFESKLPEIESGKMPMEDLSKLRSDLNNFKLNVRLLSMLKTQIESDPDYNKCSELPLLVGSINSYLTKPGQIETIGDKINQAIAQGGGDSGGAGTEEAYQAFDEIFQFNVKTFEDLSMVKYNPSMRDKYSDDQLRGLYDKLKKQKTEQDSLYAVISADGENPAAARSYKKFNEFNSSSIDIIKVLVPNIEKTVESDNEQPTEPVAKKTKFPIGWVLFPVLALLIAFGVYKYVKMAKKGKKYTDKF